jgi:hypothetical protein
MIRRSYCEVAIYKKDKRECYLFIVIFRALCGPVSYLTCEKSNVGSFSNCKDGRNV